MSLYIYLSPTPLSLSPSPLPLSLSPPLTPPHFPLSPYPSMA
jgi:hypothetical protein